MSDLSTFLSGPVDRTVVDKTVLTGRLGLDLRFVGAGLSLVGLIRRGETLSPDIALNDPSVFTALPEQLGLKLDSQRGAIDVFVVDQAEPPTGN